MTLNELELEFPDESVAVQITSVVPIGKIDPDEKLHVGERISSTLSIACGLNVADAPF